MTNALPGSHSVGQNTSVPLNIRSKTAMSAFTSVIQHSTGILAIANRQEEEIIGIQIG